ncbi:CAP domain-containing protein [Amycolatopsis anabasis]|uniref:CAP domain-containing protein n=1 Tax=Amycolatopsis anabasis TaxID=1840409 RepID=UPI001FE58658|nr:CAP domain-containing protein [Amycolatopsis anabasis]
MSALNQRHRPLLVALSVVLGVVLAAGGFLFLRGPADDPGLRITVPDTQYKRDAAPFLAGAAQGVPGTPSSSAPAAPAPATTTTPPTTTTTPPPSSSKAPEPPPSTKPNPPKPADGSFGGQVLALVNTERAKAGCGALSADDRLTAAAQGHSDDMAERNYFSHTTPDGVTFDQRIKKAGYPSPAAENIAKGSATAEQTMRMWMNSDGHRRNILNCSFKKLGVGVTKDGWYWTQNFGY